MRLNVKVDDTGVESDDWEHIDDVVNIDRTANLLRYQKSPGDGGSFRLDQVKYFHITEEE